MSVMKEAKKILVILTGGTIGSVCSDGVRGIAGDSPYLLLSVFRRRHPEYARCECDVINPFSILSENMTPNDWARLYRAIVAADLSAYQGIVITHGSDTLAYTAAAMGMLLRHLPIPVVFVAADRPVDDPQSNGISNFRAALDLILNGGVKGVFVSYKRYDTQAQAIYLATRLVSADNCRDEFSSYGNLPLGEMRDGQLALFAAKENPTAETLNVPLPPIAPRDLTLDRKVLLLRAYPGLDYSAIAPEGFAAVIHYGYHSATACTVGESTSLLRFARRCAACGTALWLGAFKRGENEMYATSRELLDYGILPFYDMSPEAAYAKAVLAYHLPDTDAAAFMERPVWFETVGGDVNVPTEEASDGN